jgi:long-chain acyl-CoA synthetase
VRDAAVVGRPVEGEERVHAVLIVDPGTDVEAAVSGANARLEDHQRVWSSSVWHGAALPRTEGTQKLKRRDLQRWVIGADAGQPPVATFGGKDVASIVQRFAAGRTIGPDTTLEEIGLSSLDRVELMMALEEAFQTTLDETALAGAHTVRDLDALVRSDQPPAPTPMTAAATAASGAPGSLAGGSTARTLRGEGPIDFPSWNRRWPSWLLRRASLPTWILPLARVFLRMRVEGREHLARLHQPVVFAANHQSHLDTPAILIALPARWRYRLAPAMAKEFFVAHFNPTRVSRSEWITNSLKYYLACQFFNAFPLPQREAGTRQTLRYIGDVLSDGYSVLIFPEGKRTQAGEINRFMPGIGMIGSRLDVPVIPVRLDGLDRVLHPTMKFPKRGPVRVAFGAPLRLTGDDYPALAKQVEDAVRAL